MRLRGRIRTGQQQAAADAGGDTSVALFTAPQEQLGLRREPVDVLVIQSAERPEDD